MTDKVNIDVTLVKQLVAEQFPQWANYPIISVAASGWDNRTFHLGDTLSVRLPSAAQYAPQVTKEHYWLPRLQPQLPLAIAKPIVMGKPSKHYPWHWSIYEWLVGETASIERIADLAEFANSLARFLKALQQCDTTNAPVAGADNFYRGGDLKIYDAQTTKAIAQFKDQQQASIFTAIWQRALASRWQDQPVWVHGDIAIGNLLINDGQLTAVIDFGQLAIGDPACDLALYWTLFTGSSRAAFKNACNLDANTWHRARGWVLWKTLCAPISGTDVDTILHQLIDEFAALT